jgi:hypothetical protein
MIRCVLFRHFPKYSALLRQALQNSRTPSVGNGKEVSVSKSFLSQTESASPVLLQMQL